MTNQDDSNNGSDGPSRWRAFTFARLMIVMGSMTAAVVVIAGVCSAPEIVAEVKPPEPTPMPTLAPTPTLRPTEIPGAFPGQHRPPEFGLSDAEVEDHVLSDIGGATRWLIARYQHGECAELTQFTVFPGRLAWLNRHSAQ